MEKKTGTLGTRPKHTGKKPMGKRESSDSTREVEAKKYREEERPKRELPKVQATIIAVSLGH